MTSPFISASLGNATQAQAGWRGNVPVALCLLIIALVPFVGIYPVFVMKAMCLALLASSFNLLFGYAGLLSFGHAAFFGTAAYVTGYAMKFLDTTPEVAIALGTACATVLGVIVGWLAIRRQGVYFAMITLALAQLLFFFYVQASWFSGGEDGVQAIPRGKLLGILSMDNPLVLYYAVVAICGIGFAVIARTVHSPFGRLLKAVRENEARVISLGYRVDAAKLLAFALSASLAGLAGATKTIVLQLATLSDVSWSLSGEIVLMTLLGGLGTLWGPITGAVLLVGIDTYLASLGPLLSTLQGFVFVLCVMYCPQGIWGWLSALRFRLRPAAYSSQVDAAASPSNHR